MPQSAPTLPALDWSVYLEEPGRQPTGAGLFLADAVQLIGEALVEWWSPDIFLHLTAYAGDLDLPPPEDAFDAAGAPVADVHEIWAREVHAVIAPATWEAHTARRAHLERWGISPQPDPMLGDPKTIGTPRDGRDGDVALPVTRQHWSDAFDYSTVNRHFQATAEAAVVAIADALVALTKDNKVHLKATSMTSGVSGSLDPSLLHGSFDRRLRRIASCRVDPDDPDQMIFVDPDGFGDAVREYAIANPARLVPEDHPGSNGITLGIDIAECLTSYGDDELKVRGIIEPYLRRKANDNWRLEDLYALVGEMPGLGVEATARDEIVEALWEDWKLEEDFSFLKRQGQPRAAGRPRYMDRPERKRLLEEMVAAFAAGQPIG